MRFTRKSEKPKYCDPIKSIASAASSEDLSLLFRDLEATDASLAQPEIQLPVSASPPALLRSSTLESVGKVHKARILDTWVACQTYLTKAESLSRCAKHGIDAEGHPLSEVTTRSGVSSRTSMSHKPAVVATVPPLLPERSSWRYRFLGSRSSGRNIGSQEGVECLGVRYESCVGHDEWKEVLAHAGGYLPAEWDGLESAWRSSLHLPGPKVKKKKTTTTK